MTMTPRPAGLSLKAGDVISYSSGSHDRGPYGFRAVKPGGDLLNLIRSRAPELLGGFGERVPLVINAYPACIGSFAFGITADSYLSLSTASRALHLAQLERLPVILIGQPLFIADLFFRHLATNQAMPDSLLVFSGGYLMPASLERTIRELLAKHVENLGLLHGYGVAEVDAGCLLAVARSKHGHPLYFARDERVGVEIEGDRLYLSLTDDHGGSIISHFPTGDRAMVEDGRYIIWNPERLHPNIHRILESWSYTDWERRTGYLYYGREVCFQLRKGVEPKSAMEAEFHDYEKRYGHYWLFKPVWGQSEDAGRDRPLRRTIL